MAKGYKVGMLMMMRWEMSVARDTYTSIFEWSYWV